MVEIGDGFRLPDLLVSTGARLREVGTTNRTTPADYAAVTGPDTGFLLKVHPSNFRITGFTRSAEVADLTGLGVPVVVDIGSGLLAPHPALPEEPTPRPSCAPAPRSSPRAATNCSADPQCGLLLGREDLVHALAPAPAGPRPARRQTDPGRPGGHPSPARPPRPPAPSPPARPGSGPAPDRLAAALAADGIDVRPVGSTATVGGGGRTRCHPASAALSPAGAVRRRAAHRPHPGRRAPGGGALPAGPEGGAGGGRRPARRGRALGRTGGEGARRHDEAGGRGRRATRGRPAGRGGRDPVANPEGRPP